jgi:hypothetical protein
MQFFDPSLEHKSYSNLAIFFYSLYSSFLGTRNSSVNKDFSQMPFEVNKYEYLTFLLLYLGFESLIKPLSINDVRR